MNAPNFRVFISYSHKDEEWKDRLMTHLGVLREEGLLDLWEDRQIGAGEDWYEKIQEAMNAADVAILLVSADSLTSKFILREEVSRLLQRRDQEGLHIFPVIIKPCTWQKVAWLSRMQVRPRDGKPLSSHGGNRRDEAMVKIATEIYDQLREAGASSNQQKPESLSSKRINITRLPITGDNLFGRERELQQLDESWASDNANVISLVAWGGVGKSALINHWLGRMALDDYRGAERIYAWSFYTQGTTDRAVSADLFIDSALRWFGDTNPTQGSAWDKGERLAQLVRAQRTLLLLDGLEPLQYPPGADEGRLKDQSLQALLRELATHNPGLCILSTRLPVRDLANFERSTAPRIDLEHLSPKAGAQILRAQGVTGEQAELEQASREFDGHSLALTLLGSYLNDVCGGDVRRRNEVGSLEEDVRYGGHARRVMASYEKWFGEGPELAVLRMLGLFNRPADKKAIDALRAAPVIAGLTDSLRPLSEHKWQQVLGKLRRARLLAERDQNQPDALDTHPLVREHFGQQLKQEQPQAWRAGNYRLYKHLKRIAKVFPDTIEEMTPLYAAVAHGCEAGRYQEALVEVYIQRIQRRNEGYNTNKLGAFGAELSTLASFFAPPWLRTVEGLDEVHKAYVLNQAGYALRALGRLAEAVQALHASLEAWISQKLWAHAARVAFNLSDSYFTIGNISDALTHAQQSVELADESTDSFVRIASRATVANTLYRANSLSEAEAFFREAEEMQKEWQPELPLLYSIRGVQYCDLLLSQGKYQEVLIRVGQIQEWAHRVSGVSLLDFAAIELSLGQAYLVKAQKESTGNFALATEHLNQAVSDLRRAGKLDYLPLGLLARAELYRVKREFSRAQVDLDEVLGIATSSKMGLHEADCYLEYARLYLAQGEKNKAQGSWAKAKEMIEQMGYHRRDKDVKKIERQLKET